MLAVGFTQLTRFVARRRAAFSIGRAAFKIAVGHSISLRVLDSCAGYEGHASRRHANGTNPRAALWEMPRRALEKIRAAAG
ncbi:hypothetical protein GCM10027414_11020 [Humibacter ginsengiterrae]